MIKVAIVVGNPKPMSRTRRIAEMVVERLLDAGTYDLQVIDLADHSGEMLPAPSERVRAHHDAIASSDLLIVASPTYKATYTGLLKVFLDPLRPNALHRVVAIPVMTGASAAHSMAAEFHLAPLLRELGATVPSGGAYFIVNDAEDIESQVGAAAAKLESTFVLLRSLVVSGNENAGNAINDD